MELKTLYIEKKYDELIKFTENSTLPKDRPSGLINLLGNFETLSNSINWLNKSSNQLSNLNIKKNNNHPSYHLDEPISKNNNIDILLKKIKKESVKTKKKLDIVQNNYFNLPKCSKLNKTKNFKPSFNKIIKVYVHYSDLTLNLNNNILKKVIEEANVELKANAIKLGANAVLGYDMNLTTTAFGGWKM